MNQWISLTEIDKLITKIPDKDRLFELYAASVFSENGFFDFDFKPDPKWGEYIFLTDYGKQILDRAQKAGLQISATDAAFLMFQRFSYHKLLIDHVQTDPKNVLALLNDMRHKKQVRWPYIHGHRLYHKFNDFECANQTDHLDAETANRLLADTPTGVFQIGNLVSGPFGFIYSREFRQFPPTLKFPLWHCSDLGCMAPHNVELQQYNSECLKMKFSIKKFLLDSFDVPSEWGKALRLFMKQQNYLPSRRFRDMPLVIGECLIGPERSRMLLRSLQSEYNSVLINELKKSKRHFKSLETTVQGLSPEEQH